MKSRFVAGQTLSDGAREVIELLAQGLTYDETSAQLGISVEAVKSRVRRIMTRFGAFNKAHLVHICWKKGLLK